MMRRRVFRLVESKMNMKKAVVALAVLAASGAVMAQSSVTLYGLADAGVGRIKAHVANNDGTDKIQFLGNTLMNNSDSFIGLRGTEDLGSGLKVGFQFEQSVDLDSGGASGQDRGANVWIGGNWGTVKLGRADAPSFWGAAAWELTGAANYSPIVNTYLVAGEGRYNDSQISYKLPNFGGFSGEIAYVSKNDRADNENKWDGNLTYANGPIGVGLSVNKTGGRKTNYLLGAKYDFGSFALATSFAESRNLITNDNHRRGVSLGGQAKLGAATLTLDLTRDLKHKTSLGGDLKEYTNGVFEAKYALSKRTSVYGAYLRFDGTNNYGVGLQHRF